MPAAQAVVGVETQHAAPLLQSPSALSENQLASAASFLLEAVFVASPGQPSASKIWRISHSPSPATSRKSLVIWIASSFELAFRIAKPATTSFDSANGPSVTLTFPWESRTRAPRLVGKHPSVATRYPLLKPSSTSFPILAISSGNGGAVRSTVL